MAPLIVLYTVLSNSITTILGFQIKRWMQRLCKTFEICATATADGTTATITTDERQRWPESHRLCCSCKNFESESGSDVFLEIPTAQQLRARVIFVDTESQALRVRVES